MALFDSKVEEIDQIDQEFNKNESFGEKLADKVAVIGGSWSFIISFCAFLLFWCLINTNMILANPLDPFPYIFLNLILSCVAAIQAPILMIANNRMCERDRVKARLDFEIDARNEISIKNLHDKIDLLISKR